MDENDAVPRLQLAYERVCESYHAVDDFRVKLLGLLPLATGSGVFVLLSTNADGIGRSDAELRPVLAAIGAFGVLFIAGLFAYELFGIKKCHYLIENGRHLEHGLGVRGQFRSRPYALAGRVNEPLASACIYPTCIAAWSFLALVMVNSWLAASIAAVVVGVGFVATMAGAQQIALTHDREQKVWTAVAARGCISVDDLKGLPGLDEAWVEAAIERLRRQGEVTVGGRVVQIRSRSTALNPM